MIKSYNFRNKLTAVMIKNFRGTILTFGITTLKFEKYDYYHGVTISINKVNL